jgi:hypothetical protein
LDARTLDIKTVFGQDRRHVVPLFQRPYVWSRKAQWEPLWEDIRIVAERVVTGYPTHAHFLGAIVLEQVPKPTGRVETRLVIDGQQRLITIQILLQAFCDCCAALGVVKHQKALLKLTRNDDPMSDDDDEQFKVWPTNVDREHFRRTMECRSPIELRSAYEKRKSATSIGHPMADSYIFFNEVIRTWLRPGEDGHDDRLDALLATMREYLRMVVIDLQKDDDAQLIFETLNARGTPLLPADLVKNFLFHQGHLAGDDIAELYEKYWRHFDESTDYWRKPLGRGHAQRARIDTFLQYYLTAITQDDVPVAHLYVEFRKHVGGGGSPQGVLESLRQYAEVYQRFDALQQGSRDADFVERVRALDIVSVYPFLLELYVRYGKESGKIRLILGDLESFLVRRLVCQLNTRGYNRLFIELLKALVGKSGSAADRVRVYLQSSDAESTRWPDDGEFRNAWMETPLFRVLVQKRIRMLFEALELEIRTGKSEKLELSEKLTIEHLLPREWKKHWPLPAGKTPEEAEPERERLLHTIGNLTLLTSQLNPSVSNGPWKRKKPEIITHTLLRLNSQLASYPSWNEAAIRKRGSALFDIAKRIWPRPEK